MDKQTSQKLGGKDVANKSTISPAELLQKERESIILKGIAAELSSMKFPNFEELDKMISKFDYGIKEIYPQKCSESEKSIYEKFYPDGLLINENSLALLRKENLDVEENKSLVYDKDNHFQSCVDVCKLLKKLILNGDFVTCDKNLKNIILSRNIVLMYENSTDDNSYLNGNNLLDFTFKKTQQTYIDFINIISNDENIYITDSPIFCHNGKIITLDDEAKSFLTLNNFKEFIENNKDIICIINFKILNNLGVDLRYSVLDKHEKNKTTNDFTLTWDFRNAHETLIGVMNKSIANDEDDINKKYNIYVPHKYYALVENMVNSDTGHRLINNKFLMNYSDDYGDYIVIIRPGLNNFMNIIKILNYDN